MGHKINVDNLTYLINSVQSQEELDFIFDCIRSFENYHSAIIEMEIWLKLYNYDNLDVEEYKNKRENLDKSRTERHNIVLNSVNALNRLASKYNIENIYNGEVSEKQPFRREVANAILEYVEKIIKERI